MLMLRLYFMVKIVDMCKSFPDLQKLSNDKTPTKVFETLVKATPQRIFPNSWLPRCCFWFSPSPHFPCALFPSRCFLSYNQGRRLWTPVRKSKSIMKITWWQFCDNWVTRSPHRDHSHHLDHKTTWTTFTWTILITLTLTILTTWTTRTTWTTLTTWTTWSSRTT